MKFTIFKLKDGKRVQAIIDVPTKDYGDAVKMLNDLGAWFAVERQQEINAQIEAFATYYRFKNMIFDDGELAENTEAVIHKDKESGKYFIQIIPYDDLYYYILESTSDVGNVRLMPLETASRVLRRLGFTEFEVSI